MVSGTKTIIALMIATFMPSLSSLLWAQGSDAHKEVGIVYYEDGASFKPLDKESAPQSGRSTYVAKVKGAHAAIRMRADHAQVFQVCGVDPTRYKLFRFKSEGSTRTVTISKTNMWIGGSKTVLSESELPIAIRVSETGCFMLTPRQILQNGEYGFSPLESLDAFMFGVGDVY